jgi:hypothetical protein
LLGLKIIRGSSQEIIIIKKLLREIHYGVEYFFLNIFILIN